MAADSVSQWTECPGRISLSLITTELSFPSGLSSLQISAIAEELARKTEDASRQQEEITHLLSQIVDLQKKAKSVSGRTHELYLFTTAAVGFDDLNVYVFSQYAVENEELSQHLVAAKDAQRQLTAEVTFHISAMP